MATSANTTTTVLSKTYPGRPMGLALDLWLLEQKGLTAKAASLFEAHRARLQDQRL